MTVDSAPTAERPPPRARPMGESIAPAPWLEGVWMALMTSNQIGYPLVGVLVTLLHLNGRELSIPFRLGVLGLSFALFFQGWLGRARHLIRLDIPLSAFLLIYLVRLVYDFFYADINGTRDILEFYLVATIIPTLAAGVGRIEPRFDPVLSRWVLGVGVATMLLTLAARQLGLAYNPWADQGVETTRLGFEAVNPISLGYAAAITLWAAIFNLTAYRGRIRWILLSLLALPTSSIVLLAAGSRGPLIAAVVGGVWFGLTRMSRFAYLAPAALILLLGGITQQFIFQHTIATLTGGWSSDGSALERLAMQSWAIRDFVSAPFFGLHYASVASEGGWHPHNILIETAMALGIVGLLLMSVVLFRTGVRVFNGFNRDYPFMTVLLVLHAVNGVLSDALWGSGAFFALLMVCLVVRLQPVAAASPQRGRRAALSSYSYPARQRPYRAPGD